MIDSIKCLVAGKWCESFATDTMNLKDEESKMEIAITELPENGLMVNVPPSGKAHSSMVKDKPGYKQSCDKLLFIPRNNDMDVYLIEMKETIFFSKDISPEKACRQIIYTDPVVDYLISMVNAHFPEVNVNNIKKYFVIIAEKKHKNLDKQKIKPKIYETCTYRDKKFRILHSARMIPFKHLQ